MTSRGKSATSKESVRNAKMELTNYLKSLETIPTAVLESAVESLEAEAKMLTPYKTGKLENSVKARVSRSKYKPGLNISASARSRKGYNYAGIQHEIEFRHPIKGQDHYLSEPFERTTEYLKQKLEQELRPPFGR